MKIRHRADASVTNAGFTLLELLIATTLLGVVLAVMAGGLRFGARVWERSGAISEATAEVNVAREFIRHKLAEARAIRMPLSTGDVVQAAFRGGTDSVEFVGDMPAFVASNGLFWISLKLDKSAGHLRLDWWPYRGDYDGARQRILLDNVSRISLSYFGKNNGLETESWSDSWAGVPHLPSLVRVQVTFHNDDDRSWPELIVAIPAAGAPLLGGNQR
jgi:general secretion pathway protein J